MTVALRGVVVVALAGAISGCNVVSGTGPTAGQIRGDQNRVPVQARGTARADYALVPVDLGTVGLVSARAASAVPSAFPPDTSPTPPQLTIRPGDEIEVTIVNTSQSGFIDFTQSSVSPLAATPLPPQPVAEDGRISVPPLGRVRAAGFTPSQLEAALTRQLGEVLVDPSVVVRMSDRLTGQVSVMGVVANPGYYPILAHDTRLLDVIGTAGGPTGAGRVAGNQRQNPTGRSEEFELVLQRGGREARVRFDRFLETPTLNIRVWPGDVIKFEPAVRRFTLLGAVAANGEYQFVKPSLTLTEALGRGRGLVSTQAARNGVFVYRAAPIDQLRRISARPVPFDGEIVPTIFSFDFTQPTAMLAAQRFEIADGDMIYIPDSPLAEVSKVLSAFNQGLSTASNIAVITD